MENQREEEPRSFSLGTLSELLVAAKQLLSMINLAIEKMEELLEALKNKEE